MPCRWLRAFGLESVRKTTTHVHDGHDGESKMAGPLAGVRIIDVSEVISGPLAVMMLAEQGADVIKVEPPKYGEQSRQLSNYRNGMAALYVNCNHGKRSIGINLKTAEGLELFYDLIRGADVFASEVEHPVHEVRL